jgi:hypothetical protein
MASIRARFLSLLFTTVQGASARSVQKNMDSLASVYSSHLSSDARSTGLSFQRLTGSVSRLTNRRSCSVLDTENQNLISVMPSLASMRSNSGASRRNSVHSSGWQKPMTRSTPARLYQDRSNITISPAAGRCAMYRCRYHSVRSFSVGFSSATTRAPRGLRFSANRLIVPPLPAASRPSKTIMMRSPASLVHRCSLSSSI